MSPNQDFKPGQKVLTPEGAGVVEDIRGNEIRVKLKSGKTVSFKKEKISDDADAG